MFWYYVRLLDKYAVPIFPIALFTFDKPKSAQDSCLQVSFPDIEVLDFRFQTIQLNRLNWRDYKGSRNPVAIALLPKMKIAQNERHLVKLNCESMLAKLKLKEDSWLIGKFVEVYLPLSAKELEKYNREFSKLTKPEKEEIMELHTSWELKGEKRGRLRGLREGRIEGRRQILVELLMDRFENISEHVVNLIENLSDAQLKEFRRLILAFSSLREAEEWLERKAKDS